MGKCKYRADWLLKKDKNGYIVSAWAHKHSETEIFCRVCTSIVNIENKGFHAILQHADKNKHKVNCKASLSTNQMTLVVTHPDGTSYSASNIEVMSNKDHTTKAELMWAMKVVCSNYSAVSCEGIAELFEAMFPGTVVKDFSLSPKKLRYLVSDALGPYFQTEMLEEAKCSFYTVLFDETTNVEDKKELQITLRFWSEKRNEVVSRHLQTLFIGIADANTLYTKISTAIREANLPLSKLLMIGSDGPNVNKKVIRLFNEEVLTVRDTGLANMGTCPIHIVHNAYLKAMEVFGEDASELLIAVYYYFDGWPSRWEEFEVIQKQLKLPPHKFIKHSATRWLTFASAALRLIEQWDAINHYFLKHVPSKSSNISETCKRIIKILKAPVIKALLHFCISSAEVFMKFTAKFQRDEPLIHLLHTEWHQLIQVLVGRACKSEAVKQSKNTCSITMALFDDNYLLPLNSVNVSSDAKNALAECSEKDKMMFLSRAQQHYIAGCKHLIEKLYPTVLVKSLRCLQPSELTKQRSCGDIVKVSKLLPVNVPDDVLLDEWKLLQVENQEVEIVGRRIDSYWYQVFCKRNASGLPKYPNITVVVKAALSLSHGNADVERRFSVSRWALTEDKASMSERTLNAIMSTKDALRQFNNCPHMVPITRRLISMARSAYQSYQRFLDQEKLHKKEQEAEREESMQLKKELAEKIKKAETVKKDIEKMEEELKEKENVYKEAKETTDALFREATDRLNNALRKGDLKEANIAHGMLEGVMKMKSREQEKGQELDCFRRNIEKRKSNAITNFVSKKKRTES